MAFITIWIIQTIYTCILCIKSCGLLLQKLTTLSSMVPSVELYGTKVSVILFQDGKPKNIFLSSGLYYSVAQWRGIFTTKCNLISYRCLIASGRVRPKALQFFCTSLPSGRAHSTTLTIHEVHFRSLERHINRLPVTTFVLNENRS
jgi:hypothetical protein